MIGDLCRVRSGSLTAILVLLLTASCTSVGPKTIPRDQFEYGRAIAKSGKEQLLFNVAVPPDDPKLQILPLR
jgi:hypothetical protein